MNTNLEEPHSLELVAHVKCEAMVNARGHDQEVTDTRVATDPAFTGVFCVALINGSFSVLKWLRTTNVKEGAPLK